MPQEIWFQLEEVAEPSVGWWKRWWLRADPRPLLLFAIVVMLWLFWEYRSPSVAMVGINYYRDFCLGAFLLVAFVFAQWTQLLVARYLDQSFWPRHRSWPWFLLIAAATYLAVWFEFPMQAAFFLSRPALDRIANEALVNPANRHLLVGQWAGLYRIEDVEVINGTVVLYTDRPEGTYGFARVPGAKSDKIYNGGHMDSPNHHQDFPDWKYPRDREGQRITGDWFVVYSGYWLVKVGPS